MTTKRSLIREDLLKQLRNNKITGEVYIDLVEDYISLWEIKNNLIKDIRERGVTIEYQNGKEQWGYKKNDSINELNKTSTQMLKILSELGLKPVSTDDGDDDGEM